MIPAASPTATPQDYLGGTGTEWGTSRWAELQRCEQAYVLRHHLQIAPRGDGPSYYLTGSLVHACLAWMADGARLGLIRDPLAPIAAAPRKPLGWDEVDPWEEAERLITAYGAHWGWDGASWDPSRYRIIAVELPLRNEIAGMPVTTQADLVLEDVRDGSTIVVDTKTRAKGLPKDEDGLKDYRRALSVRPQFLQTAWQVRELLGLSELPRMCVNAVCKLKVPTFGRIWFDPSEDAWALWIRTQESLALEDARLRRNHCPPRCNLTQCAPEVGSRCWAFDWCHPVSPEARELHYTRKESQ